MICGVIVKVRNCLTTQYAGGGIQVLSLLYLWQYVKRKKLSSLLGLYFLQKLEYTPAHQFLKSRVKLKYHLPYIRKEIIIMGQIKSGDQFML